MTGTKIDRARVAELTEQQEALLAERLARSIEFRKSASGSLANGVACSWHALSPYAVYASRGKGSRIWDLDGNEYVDMHCGYGVMVSGHAHPAVVAAVRERAALGTQFAMPVEDTVIVAELLADRFGLPLWRFENAGSLATQDAVRMARAATGRDLLVKVEGCYHGSADGLAFAYWTGVREGERPSAKPNTAGVPAAYGELLRIVPYNDLPAVEEVFASEGDRVAGMILEPIPMNAGVIKPEPGYLEGLREITRRHGAMLIYDEVKTGVTIARGGVTEWSGVKPDLVALAKAIGGGLPIGAVGGTEEVMRVVVDGTMEQEGTFNGNPLSMAAARATLTEVLTPDVYPRFEELNRDFSGRLEALIARYGVPATVSSVACRGSIHFREEPVRNFQDHVRTDDELAHLAWLYQLNGGVLPPSGDPWTFSVAHTAADLDRYVENFGVFAQALTS